MAWDEALFGWVARHVQGLRTRVPAAERASLVTAEPMLPRLRILASAVAGHSVEIALTDDLGGAAGTAILLPHQLAWLPTAEDNACVLVARTVFSAMVLRDLNRPQPSEQPDGQLAWLLRVLDVTAELAAELPGWSRAVADLRPAMLATRPSLTALSGKAQALEAISRRALGVSVLTVAAEVAPDVACVVVFAEQGSPELTNAFRALQGASSVLAMPLWGQPLLAPQAGALLTQHPEDALARDVTSERKSRPRPPPTKRRVMQDKQLQENPFTHSFEKVHTAEDYKGGAKRADGADEMAQHGDALDELDLDEVVLSNERTKAVYRADLAFFGQGDGAAEQTGSGLRYDEWDGGQDRYLPGWCQLQVDTPEPDGAAGVALRQRVRREQAGTIARVRAELARLETGFRWHTRQADGPEVDVDAVIDRQAARVAGHEGPQRLYVARRRRTHDLAVLVLLDASMSTDGWIAGRRVLDVERDAAVVLSEVLETTVSECAVAAFHSFSHSDCRFQPIKGFREPWSAGLSRLATIQPRGYTRMGPAMRHGSKLLGDCRARRKLLILLTDGKPSDTDRYEGRHGQADVRQAIREARQTGVQVFALSVDPTARQHLPAMFGHQGFAGLAKPGDLGQAIVRLVARFR